VSPLGDDQNRAQAEVELRWQRWGHGMAFSLSLMVFFSYGGLQLGCPTTAAAAEDPAAQPVQVEAVDINSAPAEQLMELPHISMELALKITAGRPFQNAEELVTREIIPPDIYDKIKDRIVVSAPQKK
jgi:DNA uptake protein ComE-like DNA-binding protein